MNNNSRRMRWIWAAVLGVILACISVVAANTIMLPNEKEKAGKHEKSGKKEKITMPMIITSPSFKHNGAISSRHTCDGQNLSPQLKWTGVPDSAKSLALIVDDPDAPNPEAPRMTWVHWVLYNIPVTASGLAEGVTATGLPHGTLQGLNDWRYTGYGGPCPPIGRHRYFFKLYALDIVLPDLHRPAKLALEQAMQGHVLAQAELIGLYQRQSAD